MLFRWLWILTVLLALTIIGCSDPDIGNNDISPPVQIPVEGVEVLVYRCIGNTFSSKVTVIGSSRICPRNYPTIQEAALALYPGMLVDTIERQHTQKGVYYFVHLSKRKE